jgi:dTDP-4-amino-4,6-dideoxygalactose transaminase
MAHRLVRVPPVGGAIGWTEGWATLRTRHPGKAIEAGLRQRLGAQAITLHASGREALRVALAHLAARSGRSEVAVPAYTCFSVAAAAVAAGLQVRLLDVTAEGTIDPAGLTRLPLERAAALVVCNLLGIAEATSPLRPYLRSAGVALVDDAAQSLGVQTPDGPVGGRGEVGVLSFGRGKPLSALGGGALAWMRRPTALESPLSAKPRPGVALARAAAYRLALVPWIFGGLSAIPALRIGETIYDPAFPRGTMDGASLCLAAALLPRLGAEIRRRRARAETLARDLLARTRFRPLGSAATDPAYPRLGVIAPSPTARDAALVALVHLGATRLYPSSLDRVEDLRPHLVGSTDCPGAQEFAARLLTLPTHGGLREVQHREIVSTLERLGA